MEITINAWDHALVGNGSNADLVIAANDALEKVEKQILKLRNKWRDTKRYKGKALQTASAAPEAPAARARSEEKLGRGGPQERRPQ